MKRAANVTSLTAMADFKAALIAFAEAAGQALSESESEITRTIFWLQNTQASHWRSEIRKRNQKVAIAKSELFRAQLAAQETRGSCVLERKALARAEAALDEAETRSRAVQRWLRVLDREKMLFKSECSQLAGTVQGDFPKAVAWMNQMIESLEAYVRIAPPSMAPRAGTSQSQDESEEPESGAGESGGQP